MFNQSAKPKAYEKDANLSRLPLIKNISGPKYSRLTPSYFKGGGLAPKPKNIDDLMKTWVQIPLVIKERLMFCYYLRALRKATTIEETITVTSAFTPFRDYFLDNDKNRIRWHIETILFPEFGVRWQERLSFDSLFRVCAKNKTESERKFVRDFEAHFNEAIEKFIGTLRSVWQYFQMATDIDRLIRKMASTRLSLSQEDRLLVDQFSSGSVHDLYMAHLKLVYGSAWRDVAIGPVQKCKFCGVDDLTLRACGLCVQEMVKKKARYCNTDCQAKDWAKHRLRHTSRFDMDKIMARNRDHLFVLDASLLRNNDFECLDEDGNSK